MKEIYSHKICTLILWRSKVLFWFLVRHFFCYAAVPFNFCLHLQFFFFIHNEKCLLKVEKNSNEILFILNTKLQPTQLGMKSLKSPLIQIKLIGLTCDPVNSKVRVVLPKSCSLKKRARQRPNAGE